MADKKTELYRMIPGVDRLLESPHLEGIISKYPRNLILLAINEVLQDFRNNIESNNGEIETTSFDIDVISREVGRRTEMLSRSSLKKIINATGVVVHTNLGRSILAEKVIRRLELIAGAYSNLEYDIELGKRGSRYSHVEGILLELTGAEAAMVVNNNAAAVLLAIETFAKGKEVIVSRGELVEIGGSFRIPDVMKKSGAKMVEVGTTNKTHPKDYEEAITPETAMLLKVHRSNFHIIGFTQDVETYELAELGKKHDLPVMEDLGSGCLIDLSKYGLGNEPTVQEILRQNVDIVTFSGDKLLGGPQAGIILGRKEMIEAIKRNQLTRALRIDKLTLLALEETLKIYRDEKDALENIPTLKMISRDNKTLKSKALRLFRMIGNLETDAFTIDRVSGSSKVGGGALPLFELPTTLLRLTPGRISANSIENMLKQSDPPIIVRVEQDKVLLDVRTIQEKELRTVAKAIRNLAK